LRRYVTATRAKPRRTACGTRRHRGKFQSSCRGRSPRRISRTGQSSNVSCPDGSCRAGRRYDEPVCARLPERSCRVVAIIDSLRVQDTVGEYETRVYSVKNVKMLQSLRFEHMSEEEKAVRATLNPTDHFSRPVENYFTLFRHIVRLTENKPARCKQQVS
jgi:hypothetical protein